MAGVREVEACVAGVCKCCEHCSAAVVVGPTEESRPEVVSLAYSCVGEVAAGLRAGVVVDFDFHVGLLV